MANCSSWIKANNLKGTKKTLSTLTNFLTWRNIMANDRNDFAPEIRASAWWSGDSRKAANGRGNEAVLEKLGLKELPDLSDNEAVQMGHVMQPIIGRLAQDRLGIELKDADYALTHPKETWLKSQIMKID